MEKVILWDNEIEKSFFTSSEQQLSDFLELLQFIREEQITDYISTDTRDSSDLWAWLGSKDQIELNDIKKELSIHIEKRKYVEIDELEEYKRQIGKMDKRKIMLLKFDDGNPYYFATIMGYYAAIRKYLSSEKKDEFSKDLPECFPAICFWEGIDKTINTLNRKFEEIREEIVEHLTVLDGYQPKFLQMAEENISYREMAERFSSDTKIECSPQSDRQDVKDLKVTCINVISEQEEQVICELHTKFRKFNIDREKQDRIYFFPGKKGIMNDRVIVKHIGKHL